MAANEVQGPTDFEVLERIKENVLPTSEGRSASSLARIFSMPTNEFKEIQQKEKLEFEKRILQCEELDDPLEPHVEYARWLNSCFPEGPTPGNGIIKILEASTNYFKDYVIYKNDPRYLKIWLQYAKYSEDPLNVFVFLYRKEIGKLLALFYEEYAKCLESKSRIQQANDVFQRGLINEAKPLRRLQNKYNEFRQRLVVKSVTNEEPDQNENENFDPFPKRQALAVKSGSEYIEPSSSLPTKPEIIRSKPKLSVFTDDEDTFKNETEFKTGGWEELGTMASRTKENETVATPWVGETIRQVTDDKKKMVHAKINVYRDLDARSDANIPVYKFLEVPGKNSEKLDINIDLLHPESGDEFCVEEILAMMRGNYGTVCDILSQKPGNVVEHKDAVIQQESILGDMGDSPFGLGLSGGIGDIGDDLDDLCSGDEIENPNKMKKSVAEGTITTTIKLNDTGTKHGDTSDIQKSPTITMTMFTKQANEEINLMFKKKVNTVDIDNYGNSREHTLENNLEDFTEHTNHMEFLKSKSVSETTNKKKSKISIFKDDFNKSDINDENQPPEIAVNNTNDYDDEITQLGNDVAELSMIEANDENSYLNNNNNNENSVFLLTPIKRPLNDSSRKGSPFIRKKLKNGIEESASFLKNQQSSTNIVDPFDKELKKELLSKISHKIQKLEGFYSYSKDEKKLLNQLKLLSKTTGQRKNGKQRFISFEKTNESHLAIKNIGTGGYGMVLLIESSKDGQLNALKVENPANLWEFYIIRTIKERLEIKISNMLSFPMRDLLTRIMNYSIVEAKRLHYYQDESYMILRYEDQGSIIDVLNLIKSKGINTEPGFSELLVIHFATELMNIIQSLHDIDIIHGDLKADNCMFRFFDPSKSNVSSISKKSEAVNYLKEKGLVLLDFGRAIDLRLFPSKDIQFCSILETVDIDQDCPELQNRDCWKYQIDYYGLANIIHTMLFGTYIRITYDEKSGEYRLVNKLKRYWKTDIWRPLFKFLLNSEKIVNDLQKPGNKILKEYRLILEKYLVDEDNSFKNVNLLQKIIFDIEYHLSKEK